MLQAPLAHAGHDLLGQLVPERFVDLLPHCTPPFVRGVAGTDRTPTRVGWQPART